MAYFSPDLAQADPLTKSGYVIRLTGSEVPEEPPMCTGAPLPCPAIRSRPTRSRPGATGGRFFGTNADRVIFEDDRTLAGGDAGNRRAAARDTRSNKLAPP